MPADVIELHPRFDLFSESTERHYDDIARKIDRIRARCRKLGRRILEFERQFVENDLAVRSGPRRGQPLGPVGRGRRLKQLSELQMERTGLLTDEHRLLGHLDRMQSALETWARDNFGGLTDEQHETFES